MKLFIATAFLLILAGCVDTPENGSPPGDPPPSSLNPQEVAQARETIRKIVEEIYPENVRSGKGAQYASIYSENARWIPPNREDHVGAANIGAAFGERAQQFAIEPQIRVDTIQLVSPDFAYVVGSADVVYTPKDGSAPVSKRFRPLWLFRNENGVWKVELQIWNEAP